MLTVGTIRVTELALGLTRKHAKVNVLPPCRRIILPYSTSKPKAKQIRAYANISIKKLNSCYPSSGKVSVVYGHEGTVTCTGYNTVKDDKTMTDSSTMELTVSK